MGVMILNWPQGECGTVRNSECRYQQSFLLPQHECEVKNHALSISKVPMPGLPLSPAGRAIAGSHPLLRRVSQQTEAKTVPQVRAYLSERLVSQVDFAANLPRL